ncbi:MFS transporter [Actinokineospora globicatena]|uniref:MFS transporter n=1 Tax=Actinokineospora globicatena TaxID=103729 RepID=UPI0020A55853|nr:MFS transporter [Actinokineospora globicatena]MCP2304764.1 putative arabinose efflux permease, MFS family [Actinokineospora globicatena]
MRTFPLPVRVLLVNQFGVNTGFYLLIPYLATHMTEDLGLSAALVGVVLGVRNLSQQGLFLLGGTAADRLGVRGVIITGCAVRAFGFGLFAVGDSPAVLLAAAVLSGVAGALFNPAVRAYIAVETPAPRRAEAFALFTVYAQTGALVGPVLGSALLLVDFRLSATVAAGIFVLLTVIQALVLPARAVPAAPTSVLADIKACLANRPFMAFTVAAAGLFTLQNQLYLVLPFEANRATGWAGSVAGVFVLSTVVTLVGQVRITRALGDVSRKRAIAVGLLVMGLGFLAPAASYLWPALSVPAVVVAVLGLAVGTMIAQPFVYELVPAFGAERVTGTYFGVFYLVSGAAAAVTTVVVGWVSDAGGWWACLVCAAVGLVCAAGMRIPERTATWATS